MMKKILSIFAIICLSVMIAPSVFAADPVCSGTTHDAGSCTSPATCENTATVAPASYACKTTCGTLISGTTYGDWCLTGTCTKSGSTYSCVVSGVPVSNDVFGPSNCIKIRSTFKMNLTNGSGVGESVELTSGAVVAPKEAFVTDCPYGAFFTKCTATITDKCVLNKPSEIGVVAMLNTIYNVTNWVFFIMTLLAVIIIVYGGFIYISAAGDPTKATKGKSILTLAMIGLAIALLAKFLPSLVKFILGVS